jgi:1-acyl-sn-glycerol-3-phosphate acyltransferase
VIRDLLQTGATVGLGVYMTGTLAPLAAALGMVDPRKADPVIQLYSRGLVRAAGIRITTRGMENLPGGTCVLACNHQSNFDPFVIYAAIHKHMRFVAKAELYRIPIFGQAMKAVGMVKVDRMGGEADRKTLNWAIQAVRERVSLIFFPEGTRSIDGALKPFKKGAAVMAIEAGVPLVPMVVAGTKEVLRKHTGLIRGGQRVVLGVGEAIATNGMQVDDRDALTERARGAVARLLEEANAELEGEA